MVFKQIAEKCVEPIVGYVKTEVGYLCNYRANIKKLRDEVVNMNAETTSMKARIQAENRSGKTKVDALAETWLTKMACVSDKADRIIKEEERETERCLMGLRPNLWACYRASKSAKKVMDDADDLKKDGKSITTVAHIDHSQCLGFEINPDFEELESRRSASEQIVAYLKDPSVKMVGMYGMGGTGKTTLAEKIGVQLYEDGTFRYVVKTDVSNSQKTDLTHIQKQIADQLQISFKNEKDDVKARAKQLREQLEKMDKVLIILDDVWSSFELREVGIPLNRELKLLITSRDLNVMNQMDSKHNVQLGVLSPEDSWKLFDRMADGVAPDRYSTARDVVKQCFGIPVLLVTIARALRNKEDLETWKEALLQLEKFEKDNYVEDGYQRIEVSYNFLPNDELKSLFLLCAQLDHRSIPIDDLLRYTMGLGLFEKREKLREVRSRLHSHLSHLKGYCLLLQDGNMEGTVRMHDVIHKFAASIANRDRRISSTVAEAQLQEWPLKDEVKQFSISLPHRHLPPPDHQLPVAFDSSKLESFLLLRSEDYDILNVPDEFFIGMKELKLVDIRRMSLSPVLCSSLNVLVKLRTLCLDYCELDDVAVIGDLPMLQVLSLKGSTVSQIERLGSSLKLLDLRDCGRLKVIASGVLSKLILLEDLRIGDSFDKWEPLQGCNSGSDHETSTTKKLASLREFKDLGNLINLDIKIPDPKTFPEDLDIQLVFAKLERFNVLIGDLYYQYWRIFNDSETLRVKLVEDIQLYEGIKVLVRKAKKLHLEEIQGVTSVSELLDMRKLERMCDDHLMLPVGSLQNLTTIIVARCNVLKYLFSSHLALRGLLCLKEIDVQRCESMESIVSRVDDEEEEIIEFTQLRKLDLTNLGGLISFYSSGNSTPNPIISSSQERQEQDYISVFNKKVVLPKLEELQLWSLKVDRILAIETERINCWFQNLTILKVNHCHNLSYLFTSSMVRSLTQLKELRVECCSSIEEIVATKGEMAGDEEEIIEFTHLRKLTLIKLGRFISFYSSGNSTPNPIISSSQERQEQDPMSSNQRLPTSLFNKKVVLPKLEELRLDSLKVDRILAIEAERINCCFQNLTILQVEDCHYLSYLFTFSLVRSLAQLKELEVRWCNSIEEIVATKGEMAGDEEEIIEFTQLRKLRLVDLGRLISFYSSGNSTPNPIISSSQERQEQDPMWSNQRLPTSLFNKKVKFPNLEQVEIGGIHKVKMIWENQQHLNLRHVTVSSCPNVTSIFPASVALALKQLEYLRINDCENLKEIVSNEEEEDGGPTFVFPRLTYLYLEGLPELERFYGGADISDWPSLRELEVDCCDKLIDHSNLNIQKLFAKIISPSLESCDLRGTNFKVRYKSWSGKLRLIGLSKMKHIWSEQYVDDQFDGIPLNLEILKVESCGSLMSLAPKSALFQNLTRLVVRGCNELIKLVASSTTAKSLVNLTEMRVSECDSLKEIVAIYDDHDGEEASNNSTEDIVFGKLKNLVLESLRSLTSFTTNNCNFQFPSLEQVTLVECPNMEFFSRGALSTPKLSGVWIEEERKMWESDLNSTVSQLYKAMNSTEEYLEPE